MRMRLLYTLVGLTSCIETFHPNVDLDSSYIVVDGSITNENPAIITLERSLNSSTQTTSKINGATITLYGDDGTNEVLSNENNGIYSGSIIGKEGVSYSVKIQLPNGRVIISDWQMLIAGAEVGELYLEQTSRSEFIDGYEHVKDGLNLNIYLDDPEFNAKFYKWKLEGTYEFHSPDSTVICFITDLFEGNFIVEKSLSNDVDLISKQLVYLESSGRKFSYGYSMEVRQYTLSTDAYYYWKKVDDQQNNVGSVFDSPPAQIEGNLKYEDNIDIPVLGFFETNAVARKRIFINPSDFKIIPVLETQACVPQKPTSIPPQWCKDCTGILGSTVSKPSYWPN